MPNRNFLAFIVSEISEFIRSDRQTDATTRLEILIKSISLWTAVHVVAKRARERAKTTTIYSRRIENLQLWSDHNE